MGLNCTTAILVIMTLVSISDGLEESLQSLEPFGAEKLIPRNITLLQEFHNHAELKSQSSGEEDIPEHYSSLELPELLPTPVPLKLSESDADIIAPIKKPSVPKKGVSYKKPSVVPKKEVHYTSSVVAKKGADPESSKPSVSPRKGVELSQENPIFPPESQGLDIFSSENIGNRNVSILSTNNRKYINTETKFNGSDAGSEKGKANIIASPQLIHKKSKSNNTLLTLDWNPLQPLSDSNSTLVTVMPVSVKSSNTGHFKPMTADDSSSSSSQVSYVPIFMIVSLFVLVIIVVAIGYHRLKDIWARRHYNYVDFLVDGMYE